MNETKSTETENLKSIGEVAEATALSTETIRVWERRYGRPVPVRLPSGHRRYRDSDICWLRRIGEALARGHRPGKVIPLDDESLDALIADDVDRGEADPELTAMLDMVRTSDEARLRQALMREIERVGPRAFITDVVAPLSTAVGRLWADGELEIRQEHFATEILEDLLRQLRESMPEEAARPIVLLTTLPGEVHRLGLQMAAAMVALAEARPSLLGNETPLEEIAAAVEDIDADSVCISVSLATAGVATDRELGRLRKLIPTATPIVVGGQGARGGRRGPRGITWIEDLNAFEAWIRESLADE